MKDFITCWRKLKIDYATQKGRKVGSCCMYPTMTEVKYHLIVLVHACQQIHVCSKRYV